MNNLSTIQRQFQAIVTGIEAAGIVDWPTDMRAGLAVYRNAYRSRLPDCLRGAFDKCRQWIGDDSFDAAAAHHLILHPPTSWTLDDLGLGFSDTLATLFPADPEIAELAWLEWEMQQIFTSPDSPVLAATDFADRALHFSEDDWLDLRLTFIPGMATRIVTTDCAALWRAIDTAAVMPPLELPSPDAMLLVWRQDMRSQFRLLDRVEAIGLPLMHAGASFEQLCAVLVEADGDDAGVAAAGTMLGRWMNDGLVSDASPSSEPSSG